MDVRKFEAPTLAEALKVVKRELGPEAVILSTKNNRTGFGLLASSSVEVTAAVSEEALDRKDRAEKRMNDDQKDVFATKPAQRVVQAYDILSGNRLARDINRGRQAMKSLEEQKAAAAAEPRRTITQRRYIDIKDDDSPAELVSAVAADRPRLSNPQPPSPLAALQARIQAAAAAQAAQAAQIKATSLANGAARAQAVAQAAAQTAPAPTPSRQTGGILPKLIAELIDAGISEDFVKEVGDELKILMVREQITREDLARLQLARVLMSRVRVARPLGERLQIPNTPRIITFVGPTGVGKTTTVAKIAAELAINQRRPVVLATTDTFKIAAVEQLQTYANILRIPLEVCPSADALANVGTGLGADDVILVDTAGYGPKDEKKLSEMKEILSGVRMETHLCVAATTRDRDLADITRRFKLFEPDYLVVTKLDETSVYGNIFNICARSHLPLSYFTMGQRVPEDMEVATKERLADLLLHVSGG